MVGVLGVLLAGGIGVGAWAVGRPAGPASGADAGAPELVCPAALARPGSATPADAVPGAPTASGTSGRLVPDRAPTAVVVCEYDVIAPAGPAGAATAPSPGGAANGPAGCSRTRKRPAPPLPAAVDSPPGNAPAPDPTRVLGTPVIGSQLPLGRAVTHSGTDPAVAPLVDGLRAVTADGPGIAAGRVPAAAGPGPRPLDSPPQPLVGLTYDDGVVWVTTLGGCGVDVTNGVVTHPFGLAGSVDAVLSADPGAASVAPVPPSGSGVSTGAPGVPDPSTASTPPNTPAPPGTGGPTVLPGPDNPFVSCAATGTPASDVLVPFTPVAVRVCHVGVDPAGTSPTAVDRSADVAARLAAALAPLPTLDPDVVCTAIGGEQWALLFTAADGTTAAVQVDAGGCGSATNGARTVNADAALYAALTAAG